MAEVKTFYHIGQLDQGEINRALSQIADRLDKLEGLRGSPKFYNTVDMNDHKITNTMAAANDKEVLTYDFASRLGSAAYAGINDDIIVGNESTGNYIKITNESIIVYAENEIIHKIGN